MRKITAPHNTAKRLCSRMCNNFSCAVRESKLHTQVHGLHGYECLNVCVVVCSSMLDSIICAKGEDTHYKNFWKKSPLASNILSAGHPIAN